MFDRLTRFLTLISGRGDLVIGILVLVSVLIMILPLPTPLVDVLITANIAASVLILLTAIYVVRPIEFSSLPSIILIATLFRLAITITTSRLVLLQADAGDIINAFGSFVIGGNLAVGLVIFLIITIAQFVVITKGSERVAEVAARFSLDALPGKQMSIDSDLRNGDINQAEARLLRHTLERESHLYGAMDGAAKFVKGDAIASIVVILVNLLGGFAVGMLQHGMSLAAAAETARSGQRANDNNRRMSGAAYDALRTQLSGHEADGHDSVLFCRFEQPGPGTIPGGLVLKRGLVEARQRVADMCIVVDRQAPVAAGVDVGELAVGQAVPSLLAELGHGVAMIAKTRAL